MPHKRVLFVCVGNACRSQMAEGFARTYGKDVMVAESAGLAPALAVPIETQKTMAEKNIDISGHVSRRYDPFDGAKADVVVNMSGYRLPGTPPRNLIEWKIDDPYTQPIEAFRKTRDAIEHQVMILILSLRRK